MKGNLKNIWYVFSGTFLFSISGVLSLVLSNKTIGFDNNGEVLFAMSYVQLFCAIFNFQSFNSLIKYLPQSKSKQETNNFILNAILLDLISIALSMISAFYFLNFLSSIFEWNDELIKMIKIACISILFSINGVFDGVLRHYSKFEYISSSLTITALIVIVLSFIGYLLDLDKVYFLFVLMSTVISKFIIDFYFFIKLINDCNLMRIKDIKFKFDKEFFKFNFYTNITSTIDIPVNQLSPFIITWFLGFHELAVFKTLEKLGAIILKISNILGQVFSPQVSRLVLKSPKDAIKFTINVGVVIFVFGILCIFLFSLNKNMIISFLFNGDNELYYIIIFYLFLMLYTSSFCMQHYLFIFLGYEKKAFKIALYSNFIYLIIIFPFIYVCGLWGVIISKYIQSSFVFISKMVYIKNEKN
ncbi:lipopolysaccharide biosynthesis protein [Aliivibrio fischeri]|uniref:lipopolysaccharide biosynthesis protein n=1 Tax=Aliivibrio fischeri TaxID=668 RepID=UPI0012D8993D|nr:oligosaccharide flippase family protein [Aliivibrio fischeri]MUI52516.1 oligosaccharide flippase family protein [Aliivibrio fischeri]